MCQPCAEIYDNFKSKESAGITVLYWGVTSPKSKPILARRIYGCAGDKPLLAGRYAAISVCDHFLLTEAQSLDNSTRYVDGVGTAALTPHARQRADLDFASWCLSALRDKTEDCDLTEAFLAASQDGLVP